MKQKSYDTVSEALADLKKLGYTIDFSNLLSASELSPDDFEIDDFYRFEGESDPGDAMIVYAISSKNNSGKGFVVNAYGVYADNASSAIVKRLNVHPDQGNEDIVDNITHYIKNHHDKKKNSSPKGTCPICWGHQQYDGKIKNLLIDKQIDINNHKDSYMLIQDFVKHNIDGIKLKKGTVTDCPTCLTGVK